MSDSCLGICKRNFVIFTGLALPGSRTPIQRDRGSTCLISTLKAKYLCPKPAPYALVVEARKFPSIGGSNSRRVVCNADAVPSYYCVSNYEGARERTSALQDRMIHALGKLKPVVIS